MPFDIARALEVSGDTRALTWTELDAQVSEAFEDMNLFVSSGVVRMEPLAPGTASKDFVTFGNSPEDPLYHVPGAETEGGTVVQQETNVAVDDVVYKELRLPYEDQTLSQFDLSPRMIRECARHISEQLDNRVARLLVNCSRTAAVTNIHEGGTLVDRRNVADVPTAYPVSSTGAANFEADLAELAYELEQKNIDPNGIDLFVSPYIKHVLTQSTRLVNRDYVPDANALRTRFLGQLYGFNLIVTNHMPSGNITAGAYSASGNTDLSKYTGDYRVSSTYGQPVAVGVYRGAVNGGNAAHGAVVGVEAAPPMTKVYWHEETMTWRMKHQRFYGLGTVDQWLACSIAVNSNV